jgi:hypothetical protein
MSAQRSWPFGYWIDPLRHTLSWHDVLLLIWLVEPGDLARVIGVGTSDPLYIGTSYKYAMFLPWAVKTPLAGGSDTLFAPPTRPEQLSTDWSSGPCGVFHAK